MTKRPNSDSTPHAAARLGLAALAALLVTAASAHTFGANAMQPAAAQEITTVQTTEQLALTPSSSDAAFEVVYAAAAQALTPTEAETEGPYFKASSPETQTLVQPGMAGTVLTITGQVLATDGQPIAGALLDFWQANNSGAYDNSGYTLRGHQYADANGQYTLQTVVPGLYPGRTRHIHVKVQAPGGQILTTQLYFPNEPTNSRDGIFSPSLVMNVQDNGDGTMAATFNFVVNAPQA
ncbi:MAG: hypothetical protein QOF51_2839 [Chloroflexota bacterium]|jgi:protocatechuate 3,4-dioxygenase beta subunit|nr:hypothetical protein [Chloroflexota bacterium]